MKIVKADILNLAGQGIAITVVMAATIIQKYDLAWRFLDRTEHPEWQGVTRRMLESFPTDMEFWESEYHEAYIKSLELQDKNVYVNKFYRKHRARLSEDAQVNNKWRKEKTNVDALQHCMHLYFSRGREAFMSEFQNEPLEDSGALYTLTPRMVMDNLNKFDRGDLPGDAEFLVGMADVNYIGLNWVVCGFSNDFTGFIADYGKNPSGSKMLFDPENSSETDATKAITKGIMQLVQFFMAKEFGQDRYIDLLCIDANFQTSTVHKAIAACVRKYKPQFKIRAHRGRSSKHYGSKQKTLIGKPGDECHEEYYVDGKLRFRQIVQNSDYWRMAAQKAFLNEYGVPGSCTIFGTRSIEHDAFAREICAERLDNFASTDKGNLYKWNLTPGQANDKLDALVGCYAGASLLGASFDGGESAWRKRSEPQKKKQKLPPPPKRGSAIRRRY